MKYYSKMTRFLILLATLMVVPGCLRDPNVRMQRFFANGERYFQAGKYPEAAIEFQNALQIDKNFAAARYKLGASYLHQGLWPNAYRELSLAVDMDPKNIQAQLDLAAVLFAAGEFQNAKNHAQAVLKDNPSSVEAQVLLANSEAALGDSQAALEAAQRAVQMAPDKATPYVTLAVIQEKMNRIVETEQTLEKALSIDPKFLPARLVLGGFYQRRQRWNDAELQFRKGIEIESTNTVPRAALAWLFVTSGRKEQAERTLEAAKAALPGDPLGYRLLGDFYVATGEQAKALTEFASLQQAHPKDIAVKKRYIELLINGKQFDRAMTLNEELLKEKTKDSGALIAKGEILNLQHKAAEAIPVLETAVRSSPDEPRAHFQLGLAYEMTANLVTAQKELREAVRRQPWMLNAQQALAELALRNGDTDLLDESALAWQKFSPSAPQGYLYHGIALAQKGDVSAAETHLYKAIQMDPKFASAYSRLGDLRFSQKRLVDAEKLYEQALALDPQEVNALQNLVNVYLAQKKPEKAMQRAETQAAKVPENSAYQMLLGQTLLTNHKSPEAEAALKKSVELDKSNLVALLLLAQVQEQNGHIDEAATSYETAVRGDSQNAGLYTAFGVFEEHRGAWQKAEQLYRKALDFQADQATAANNLSYLLLEHGGDVDTALSLAQIARRGMPDSPNTADTLAWAYYKKGVYNSAIDLLKGAIQKVPQNSTYYYHLGLAYRRVNDRAQARNNFQRALQLEGVSPRSQEIRELLTELSAS